MTPTDLRAQLARLGLTQTGAARLLGVNPRTVRRWLEDGDIPPPVVRLLGAMEAVPGVREWMDGYRDELG